MLTVTSTSSTEGVKYFLERTQQENIRAEEPFQAGTVVFSSLLSPAATEVFNTLQSQTVLISANVLQFRGSVGITSQIEEVLNQLHQDWIKIPKPAEVRDYLLRCSDLTNILPLVCRIARERFGMYTQLSLEVYHDPEIEDEYLTLYVRQEHYDKGVLDTIEDICTQYEGKLAGKSGWLLVTTDFRPPK